MGYLFLAFTATGLQLFALLMIGSVTQFADIDLQTSGVTKHVFSVMEYFGLTTRDEQFTTLLAAALISFCLSCGVFIVTIYYQSVIQTRVFVNLHRRLVGDLMMADYQYFTGNNIGHLNNVVTQQIKQCSQSFKFYTNIITSTLLAGAYLAAPLVTNYRLVVLLCIAALPLAAVIGYINRKTKQYSIESVAEQSRLNGILFQMLSHFKYLKSTATYPAAMDRHMEHTGVLAKLTRRLALLGAVNEHGLMAFAVAFSIIMVGWQYLVQGVPLIQSAIILGLMFFAVRKLSTVPSSYQKFLGVAGAILVCRQVGDELAVHRDDNRAGTGAKPDFNGDIKLEKVSFVYDDDDREVLSDLNLTIPAKSSIAFVGGSGSGKSTLVNIITGLLRPTSGTVGIDGVDYRKLDLRQLRSGIGYVTQEPVVFNETVIENIRLWNDGVSKESVEDGAKRAKADEFIRSQPDGYDTMLGDNGVNLSGGQRQRITIARELLRETPVLVLDEATSALDSETERGIQSSIDACRGRQTLIIIAHRLSTIKNCDCIFVLDGGTIIESGAYDELYRRGGVFKRMVDTQTLE